MLIRIYIFTALFIPVICFSIHLEAQVPQLLNYQGRLAENGVPFDGTAEITFSLYITSSGGTALWSETHNLEVQNGIFNVLLGSGEELPDNLFLENNELYLGLSVNDNNEFEPRSRVTSVAYASRSNSAATVDDGAITSQKLADNAVTTISIADGSITEEKLAEGSVTGEKIADGMLNAFDVTASSGPDDLPQSPSTLEILSLSLPPGNYVVNAKLQVFNQDFSASATVRCNLTPGDSYPISLPARQSKSMPLQTIVSTTTGTTVVLSCRKGGSDTAQISVGERPRITAVKVSEIISQ